MPAKLPYIGLLASWWMGVCLGFPIGLISLIHPSWREQVKITLKSYIWIVLTGIAFSLLGLVWGWSLSPDTLPPYPYPVHVIASFVEQAKVYGEPWQPVTG